MKIKQRLISSPSSIIGLICLLVGIICLNSYLNNYRYRLTLTQLNISIALLQSIKTEPGKEINKTVSEKLRQLRLIEKNTKRINYFSQLASISILIGSLLLGVIFFHNVNKFIHKLNWLSREVNHISQSNLDECRLDYPVSGEPDNEIDSLASALERILRNFKQSIREKNGALSLLQQSNKELKQRQQEM